MSASQTRDRRRPSAGIRLLALGAGVAATAGVAAVWMGVSVMLRDPSSWMAVVAALDAALLLRLASFPPGRERAAIAIGITFATVVFAGFLFATAHVGLLMGMRPSESVWKMSPGLALLYVQANTGFADYAWVLGALGVAWRAGR